ncbi:hypothetical protein ACMU_03700 [Actibacterium mucosum KCTC 23349]|uniref:Fatty acid desaturase domain-containing protein n=1 Tax=Actibacterium mucosum KCTC 23349 TaxID=1454373 RepID=A0A037ZHA1_9RHOB|nr:hypothetical protein ACMU_03700 [Actibacterium mucosum KCTC 23349]
MRLFSAITLTPAGLLALAGLAGGGWVWAALIYMTALTYGLDRVLRLGLQNAPEGAEFPASDRLLVALGVAHFVLFLLAVMAVSGQMALTTAERIGAFFAFGLYFGQVSNSAAHELIHRGARPLHQLGRWMYIWQLFGHHASAHPLIHHRWVATPRDPNSARFGENVYAFACRAWVGSFRAGLQAENARTARASTQKPMWQHPFVAYVLGAMLALTLSWAFAGPAGMAAHLALAVYATFQLLISDYVQHYGLQRAPQGSGYEPVGPAHSWNARQWFSGRLMLHAPRHSDHHAHPTRPYPALHIDPPNAMPRLPHSLPVMGMIALIPPLWRRSMDHRVGDWLPGGKLAAGTLPADMAD